MGCQKEIAQTIIDQKGDYVLALKGNHANPYQEVVELFKFAGQQDWKGLQSIGRVESERRVKDKITVERIYYSMSIESDAPLLAQSVRSHWGIENQLY